MKKDIVGGADGNIYKTCDLIINEIQKDLDKLSNKDISPPDVDNYDSIEDIFLENGFFVSDNCFKVHFKIDPFIEIPEIWSNDHMVTDSEVLNLFEDEGKLRQSASLLFHALNDYEEFCRANNISSNVPELREELGEKLKQFRQEVSLEDIKKGLCNKKENFVEDVLGIEENDLISVSRMIKSNGLFLKNESERELDVGVIFQENNKFLVRIEEDEVDNRYYLVGIDDSPNKFFIHRLRTKKDINPDKTSIRNCMGYDQDYKGNLNQNVRYRIQGDLVIKREDYQDWRERLKEKVLNKQVYQDPDKKQEISNKWFEGQNIFNNKNILDFEFRTSCSYPTLEKNTVEKLRKELDISKEQIQQKSNYLEWLFNTTWKRLSQKRKLKCILYQMIDNFYKNNPEEERKISNDFHDKWEKEKQVTIPADNHNVILGKSIPDFTKHGLSKNHFTSQPMCVIVHDKSKLIIHHNEHENISINIPKGYYKFTLLDRHPLL